MQFQNHVCTVVEKNTQGKTFKSCFSQMVKNTIKVSGKKVMICLF